MKVIYDRKVRAKANFIVLTHVWLYLYSWIEKDMTRYKMIIWGNIGIKLIEGKMSKNWLRWFEHVKEGSLEASMRVDCMIFSHMRKGK